MVNRGSDPNLEPKLEAAERRARKTILPLGFKPESFTDPLTADEMRSLLPGAQRGEQEFNAMRDEFLADPLAGRARGLPVDVITKDFARTEETTFDRAREKIQGGLKPSWADEIMSDMNPLSALSRPFTDTWGAISTPYASGDDKKFRVDPEKHSAWGHLDRWSAGTAEMHILTGVTGVTELEDGILDDWGARNIAARKILDERIYDNDGNVRTKELGNLLTPKEDYEISRRLIEFGVDRPWYERMLGAIIAEGPKEAGKTVKLGYKAAKGFLGFTKKSIPLMGKMYENAATLAYRRGAAFKADPKRMFRGLDGQGLHHSKRAPGPIAKEVLGDTEIHNGLSRYQELMNVIRPVPHDSVLHPTFEYRNTMQLRGESVSATLSHEMGDLIYKHFPMDDIGLVTQGKFGKSLKSVKNIPEAGPSIGDIAENLDIYWKHLSTDQQNSMIRFRELLAPFEQVAVENGVRNIIRFDRTVDGIPLEVLDRSPGPFYWPRGSVDDGYDSAKGWVGSANNSAKTRRKGSGAAHITEQAGLDRNFPEPAISIRNYVMDIYRETSGNAVREYVLSAVDPITGKKLASLPSSRIDEVQRATVITTKAKIANRIRTAIGQSARIKTLQLIEGRQRKAADTGGLRLSKAEERFGTYDGYMIDEMDQARENLTIARNEAVAFAKEAGATAQQLKFAKGNAKRQGRMLDALIEEWNQTGEEADRFLHAAGGKGAKTDINAANALSRKLTAQVDKAAKKVETAAAKVDALVENGDLMDDLKAVNRQEIVDNNKVVRNMSDKERTLNGLKREVQMLDREQNRLNRALQNATNATERAQINSMITDLGLSDARVELRRIELDWTQAKEVAGQVPLGERAIAEFGLQGVGFPGEVAKAINAYVDMSSLEHTRESLKAITDMHRSLRSTADFSAPGIQGLLAMHNAPKATQEAMKVMFRAIGSEHSLGAYMGEFNIAAKHTGRLSSSQWATYFLRIGASNTEFRMGTAKAPGALASNLEMFNRSFGYYGDTVRLQWADSILKDEMAGGGWLASFAGEAASKLPLGKKIPGVGLGQKRTLQEIIDSGDMEKITTFVNNATGWTKGKTFGTVGDISLFAPRFLQSRLTTTLNAAKGMVPGASIENRLARRAVVRLIGQGTLMTVGLNAMLGNETDFRPFLDENFAPSYTPSFRKNNNFMRVRIGGRDFSLFGTYDSLLSVIMNPVSSTRSLASGPAQVFMDMFMFDENAIGEQNPEFGMNLDFGMWALGTLAPFSFEDYAEAGSKAKSGNIPGTIASVGTGAFGLKSSPMTDNEKFKEVANNAIENDPSLSHLRGRDYFSLDGPEQELVLLNTEVNEAWEQRNITRDARNAGVVEYKQTLITEHTRYTDELNKLALTNSLSNAGKLKEGQKATFGRSLRTKIAKEQAEHYGRIEQARIDHPDASDYTYEDRPGSQPVDEGTAHYIRLIFDDELEDDDTLHFDYKERDRRLDILRNGPIREDDPVLGVGEGKVIEGLENGYGDEVIDLVEAGFRDDDPDIVKKLRADRDLLSDYFTLTEDYVIENNLESEWLEYLNTPPAERRVYMLRVDRRRLKALLNHLDAKPPGQLADGSRPLSIREQWVKDNGEEADRALIFWGYRNNPVFKNVRAEFEATAIKRARDAEARRKFFAAKETN